MEQSFERTEMLIGKEGLRKLAAARVAVFGVGGVGGYVVEALARSGVGSFVLIDNDTVSRSNINRQIIATEDTIGRKKVEVMRERILSINPQADVEICPCFYLPEKAAEFDFASWSYVVDAVDTVTAKLDIVGELKKRGVKKLKVVYSTEEPIKTSSRTPGSVAFVPSAAGLIAAGEVVRDLIEGTRESVQRAGNAETDGKKMQENKNEK